jgi:hypothetical protein
MARSRLSPLARRASRGAVRNPPATAKRSRRPRPRRSSPVRPPRPAPPATVLVRPEIFRTIAGATLAAGECETGGPLIGTVLRSWDGPRSRLLVSILGTVPPGPRVRRAPSSVALGRSADGERAASALRWWRSVTGLDLLHLGDWHRHPSGSPEPSGGDRATARRMRAASAAPVWLTAIAVSEHASKTEARAEGNAARFSRTWAGMGTVRFYREVDGAGLVRVPIRVEGDAIPGLPALPWHIAAPARFAAECRLLDAAGLSLAIDASSGERPGLALRIDGDGAHPLTVVTGPRYPHEAPRAFDGRGRRVKPRAPWSPDRFLVDLVDEVR